MIVRAGGCLFACLLPVLSRFSDPWEMSDLRPHSDQVAVTICVHALRRNLCKLDETFLSDTDPLLEKKRNLALVCWLGVRLRSRRVFGLAARYLLPVVGFE